MDQREACRQRYEAPTRECQWLARVDAFKAEKGRLTAQAKADLEPHFDALRARLDAAERRLVREIAAATDGHADDLARCLDRAWREVSDALDRAFDAVLAYRRAVAA